MVAFMLAFSGGTTSLGSPTNPLEPPGPSSQATHAAVGTQLTLDGPADVAEDALLDSMVAEADQGDVGLVARGKAAGLARGWTYLSADLWQSDRRGETLTRAALELLAGVGSELTVTVVPKGTERRIGIDRDADFFFDRDELDAGTDPADLESRPRTRFVPDPRRP
jgi:hypothetical protein